MTVLAIFILNLIIGAGVWAAIDTEDKRFYKWYSEAPFIFLNVLMLSLWPVGVYFYLKENK